MPFDAPRAVCRFRCAIRSLDGRPIAASGAALGNDGVRDLGLGFRYDQAWQCERGFFRGFVASRHQPSGVLARRSPNTAGHCRCRDGSEENREHDRGPREKGRAVLRTRAQPLPNAPLALAIRFERSDAAQKLRRLADARIGRVGMVA